MSSTTTKPSFNWWNGNLPHVLYAPVESVELMTSLRHAALRYHRRKCSACAAYAPRIRSCFLFGPTQACDSSNFIVNYRPILTLDFILSLPSLRVSLNCSSSPLLVVQSLSCLHWIKHFKQLSRKKKTFLNYPPVRSDSSFKQLNLWRFFFSKRKVK